MSVGKMECEMNRRIGAVSKVMQVLYWTIAEQGKLPIYLSSCATFT